MLMIREVFFCKPGQVRPMVEKFKAMNAIGGPSGMPKMRIMTDFCAEQYWTVVSEFEVESIEQFEAMMRMSDMKPDDMKKMEEVMKDYHDLVDHGRREIYKLEG